MYFKNGFHSVRFQVSSSQCCTSMTSVFRLSFRSFFNLYCLYLCKYQIKRNIANSFPIWTVQSSLFHLERVQSVQVISFVPTLSPFPLVILSIFSWKMLYTLIPPVRISTSRNRMTPDTTSNYPIFLRILYVRRMFVVASPAELLFSRNRLPEHTILIISSLRQQLHILHIRMLF